MTAVPLLETIYGSVLRVQVRVWLRTEKFAERRLRRAYDALAAHDSHH